MKTSGEETDALKYGEDHADHHTTNQKNDQKQRGRGSVWNKLYIFPRHAPVSAQRNKKGEATTSLAAPQAVQSPRPSARCLLCEGVRPPAPTAPETYVTRTRKPAKTRAKPSTNAVDSRYTTVAPRGLCPPPKEQKCCSSHASWR